MSLELGRELRRPTSQPTASQYQQTSASVIKGPLGGDLSARRATLTLTPPSAGFQVPPMVWGGPARIASESSETSFLICGTSKWPACDDLP